MNDTAAKAPSELPSVSFGDAFRLWAKIGILSFGGPAGQIALMHRMLVDERRWLSEERFLHALNFCMLLPGPEAMQLATYTGWLLHGWRGGVVAGLLFILPGALVVLVLSAIFAFFGETPLVAAVFFGVKAAVLAIVIEALLRIARRALKARSEWAVAGLAFAAIFFFGVPFPLIVLAAAIIGYRRSRPGLDGTTPPDGPRVSARGTAATVLFWGVVWLGPLGLLAMLLGPEHVYSQIGWFFSKLAIVTFGGAYAVLAYMAQQAVEAYGWLSAGEMLSGLGLAETTPGPLILVTQFVGFLAGFGHGATFLTGLIGAAVALWATFAPCFLWIFAGAPYVERLRGRTRLAGALAAITAAVVGVILNLAVWFGLHVLFAEVDLRETGVLKLWIPALESVEWAALGVFVLALILLFPAKRGILTTLGICAVAGAAWQLLA